jgi:hypothetical protein
MLTRVCIMCLEVASSGPAAVSLLANLQQSITAAASPSPCSSKHPPASMSSSCHGSLHCASAANGSLNELLLFSRAERVLAAPAALSQEQLLDPRAIYIQMCRQYSRDAAGAACQTGQLTRPAAPADCQYAERMRWLGWCSIETNWRSCKLGDTAFLWLSGEFAASSRLKLSNYNSPTS